MRQPKQLVFSVFLALASAAFFLSAPNASLAKTTVTLDQSVHFTTAEGSDVVLDAGDYDVDAADEWLRVTPSEGQAVDALLLEAQLARHEEALKAPLGVSAQGESPDTHHLALLLPDGKRLETIGSYSGIRSRGLSLLTIRRLKRLAAASKSTTEQRSAYWGGSGGTRNFNMDCGSGGAMVGLVAKWGSWLDQLGVMCRKINSDGRLGSYYTRGPYGGSGGAISVTKQCSSDSVIYGFGARTGAYVNKLTFQCQKWNPGRKRREGGLTSHEEVGTTGILASGNSFGCQGGSSIVKAIRGRSGIYIDRVQVVCDAWNK